MSHHTDDTAHKGNGSRRPTQIMAEINRTRDEMDDTLSAIEQRLTPGQLVDQGLDYLKNSGAREYAANLGSSVKTNPLPVTLAGIGIAWLMAASNRPAQPANDADRGPGIGERMQSAKDAMGSRMQSAGSKIQSAKDSLTGGMQSTKESLSSGMQSARENWDYVLRENPLVLGAIGLAIGAVAAALAPRTRAEDEMMGEARDNLVDKAKQAGAAKLEEAKQAAASVKDTAVEAVKSKAEAMTQSSQKPGGSDGEWPYAAQTSLEKTGNLAKPQPPKPPSGIQR